MSVYNGEEFLEETMESVLKQTFKDFEWIIIDGGSTDGSKELIEQYSQYISFGISEPDNGIYNAMNKGIKQSNGEYILFLNSGDWLYDNKVLGRVVQHKFIEDFIIFDLLLSYPQKETFKKLLPSLILGILGLLFIIFSNSITNYIVIIIGGILLIYGLSTLIYAIYNKKKYKRKS